MCFSEGGGSGNTWHKFFVIFGCFFIVGQYDALAPISSESGLGEVLECVRD